MGICTRKCYNICIRYYLSKFIKLIFKLDCSEIVINVSEKYKDILINDYVNYQQYKLSNILTINLSKHPFNKESNTELFFVFKQI